MERTVTIVGGGVIGLSCAYFAAQRGFRVTVIERATEKMPSCSTGNAGMIVPSHVVPLAAPGMIAMGLKMMFNSKSPFYLKPQFDLQLWSWVWKFYRSASAAHVNRSAPLLKELHLASRACFVEWDEKFGGRFRLATDGLLMICKSKATLDHEARDAERASQLGIPTQTLDRQGLADMEPGIEMDVAGAVYYPMDCCLSPGLLMESLVEDCRSLGVEFHWGAEIDRIEVRGHRVVAVHAGDRAWTGDEFVVCGGVWSTGLMKSLDLEMPMLSGKGYSLTVEKPRELPKHCAILTEARVAITPLGDRLRFGGTMELGAGDGISPNRIRGIVESVPKFFPRWTPDDFEGIQPWFGHRPCSPDGLPFLGRPSRFKNLVVATGHAMMGISLAPVTGKLCGELLSGDRLSIPIGLLSPDRFCRRSR